MSITHIIGSRGADGAGRYEWTVSPQAALDAYAWPVALVRERLSEGPPVLEVVERVLRTCEMTCSRVVVRNAEPIEAAAEEILSRCREVLESPLLPEGGKISFVGYTSQAAGATSRRLRCLPLRYDAAASASATLKAAQELVPLESL